MNYIKTIVISPSVLIMKTNEWCYHLKISAFPSDADCSGITWYTTSPNIVSVNAETGVIFAKSPGKATIYAKACDGGGAYGTCEVTVYEETSGLLTKKDSFIRLHMDFDESSKLKDKNGNIVILKAQTSDTVRLLDTNKIAKNGKLWYKILYDNMVTYVLAEDDCFEVTTLVKANLDYVKKVRVNVGSEGNLNVRFSPYLDRGDNTLGVFSHLQEIYLLNQYPQNHKWFCVYGITNDNKEVYGWCSGDCLEQKIETGTLLLYGLTMRSGPGTAYDAILYLSMGDVVKILDKRVAKSDGYDWHKIVFKNNIGYVADELNDPYFTFGSEWEFLVNQSYKNMTVSNKCVQFVADYEGFYAHPYDDGAGNLTIGYGHLILPGEEFTEITEEEAIQLLKIDMVKAESLVNNFSNIRNQSWKQQEFDALVSFAMNVGRAVDELMGSLIAGKNVYEAFSEYCKASGKFMLGLYRRRMDEADIFLYGSYEREYRDAPSI